MQQHSKKVKRCRDGKLSGWEREAARAWAWGGVSTTGERMMMMVVVVVVVMMMCSQRLRTCMTVQSRGGRGRRSWKRRVGHGGLWSSTLQGLGMDEATTRSTHTTTGASAAAQAGLPGGAIG